MVKFERFMLDNGLKVLVHTDQSTPMAVVNVLYDVGARDEDEKQTGFAHLFEHLMFGGSVNIPDYDDPLQVAGGENNAYTNDLTNYYCQLPSENLETAFWLESDRMLSLAFSKKSLDVQRKVVCEEFKEHYINKPYGDVWHIMRELAFKQHPYRWMTIGKELSHVENAQLEDVKRFFFKHYTPCNAILVVAGDVTPDEVRKLAQDTYGKLPARNLEPRSESAEPPRMAETRMTITRRDARVPIFSRLYRVPSYSQARPGQAQALETYGQLLGGGQTSMLYRVLVEQKKLASDAGASYDGNNRDAGEFSIYAVPRPGVTLQALEKAVDEVLLSTRNAPPQAADLTRAKTGLIASVTYRRDSQMSLAMAYGQALTIGLTVDDVNEWPARIRAVTADNVRRAAQSLSRNQAVPCYLLPGGSK